MSDTEEQAVVAEEPAPTQEPAPVQETQVTQVREAPPVQTVPAQTVPIQPAPRRRGWHIRGWHWGIFAGIIVVVAAAFFTIGWFASDHGGHDRMAKARGIMQQMNSGRWGRMQGGAYPQGGSGHQGYGPWQGYPGRPGMNGQSQPNGGGTQQVPAVPQTPTAPVPSTPQTPNTPQTPSALGAYLGVGLVTVTAQVQQQYGLSASSGAVVAAIDGSGPAVKAGVRQGDVITGIDGVTVTQSQDVVTAVGQKKPGDSVTLTLNRAGQTVTIQVTLGQRQGVTG